MKTDLHPEYIEKAKVVCACGNTFTVGSTKAILNVEICSNCHPFYTGKEKLVDTTGRIEKFQKRLTGRSQGPKKTSKVRKASIKKSRKIA